MHMLLLDFKVYTHQFIMFFYPEPWDLCSVFFKALIYVLSGVSSIRRRPVREELLDMRKYWLFQMSAY